MASLTDLEVVSGPGVSSSGSPVTDRAGLRSAATAIIGSPSNGQAKGIGRHWLAYSQPHGGCVTGRAHRMNLETAVGRCEVHSVSEISRLGCIRLGRGGAGRGGGVR